MRMKYLVTFTLSMISIICFAQNGSGQSSIEKSFDGRLSYAQQIAKIENPTMEDIDKILSMYLEYAAEGFYDDRNNGKNESPIIYPFFKSGLRNAFAAYLDMVERFKIEQRLIEKYLFDFGEFFENHYIARETYPRYRSLFYNEYLEVVEPKAIKGIIDAERMKKAYSYQIYYYMNNGDLPTAKTYAKRYLESGILDRIEDKEDEKERLEYILCLTQIPE